MAVKTGLGDWGGRIRTCASEIGGAERRVAQCEIGLSVQLSSCSRSSKDEVKSALERRRVRRIWFSDAEVRIPPSRLRVLANSDSGTQRFESCRPSQPVQYLSRSRRQQYQEILSPRIAFSSCRRDGCHLRTVRPRRLFSTTRAPWRSVIGALGQRWQAARYVAFAIAKSSTPARCSMMFSPSSVHLSMRYGK